MAVRHLGSVTVVTEESSSAAQAPALLAVLGRGLVDPNTPIIRADDAGLTRGDGCFEGCRVMTGRDGRTTVAKLEAHLARMAHSAAGLQIPFDEPAWRELVSLAAQAWTAPGEAALKLVLTRGPTTGDEPTGYAWITPLAAAIPQLRRDGLRIVTLERGVVPDAFAGAPWLLGGVKTLSYAINMAAGREAERRGADDVVFVAADGTVLEAPTATVVWSVGRTLHTTPPELTGILAGTTQQLLYAAAAEHGWRTEYTLGSVADLHAADVVWLVSSTRGPVGVVELDGKSRERVPDVDAEIRRLAGFPVPQS
jgi:4-amino-4-deoxychorismate lyase